MCGERAQGRRANQPGQPARAASQLHQPALLTQFRGACLVALPRRLPARREVDHVITTRELAALIKERGWDYASLPEEEYDPVSAHGRGAGQRAASPAALPLPTRRRQAKLTPALSK